MISINNLHLQFKDQVVFNGINSTVNKQDRIGLVGRNGTGKSTLLKVIAQQAGVDSGFIEIQKSAHIAYMPQEVVIASTKNVLDETLSSLRHLFELAEEKSKLEPIITNSPTEAQVSRYAEIEHELLEQKFNEKKVEAQKMLSGLGFNEKKQQLKVSELSVGWRMRVVLAKLLLQNADFYLFDEPTNHLDIATKNWFLDFLQTSSFGYILVCHDRYFLDKACDKTFELSQGKLNVYQGNYSYYKNQKEIRSEQQLVAYKKQQHDIRQKERTIERFRSKSSKAKMAQSMIKSLEKMEKIELESTQKNIHLQLHAPKRSGHQVMCVKNVAHSFDKQLFKHVTFDIEREDKVAIVAPNGTGKTTLFNLIAKKLPLQKGSIEFGHQVTTALFDQDQEKVLHPDHTIFQEVSSSCDATEQHIRSVLGSLLFNEDDIEKKCHVLSGGERNRVAMAKVILSNANFLLLDEPTNHLDLESKEIILQALQQFEGTVLFVSHDQDFVNKLANKIIELNEHGAFLYLGNYDSYLTMKQVAQKAITQNKTKQKKEKIDTSNNKQNYDLQKKCKNLENKVDRLEQQLQKIVEKLEHAEYGTPKFQKLENDYKETQITIAEETQRWEKLLAEIEGDMI